MELLASRPLMTCISIVHTSCACVVRHIASCCILRVLAAKKNSFGSGLFPINPDNHSIMSTSSDPQTPVTTESLPPTASQPASIVTTSSQDSTLATISARLSAIEQAVLALPSSSTSSTQSEFP